MSDLTSLPDRLLEAAHPYAEVTLAQMAGLLTEAADRISELEEELLRLRCAVAAHRNANSFNGELRPSDGRLYDALGDLPWGKAIKGDG